MQLNTVNINLEVKYKSWPGYFLNISQKRISEVSCYPKRNSYQRGEKRHDPTSFEIKL